MDILLLLIPAIISLHLGIYIYLGNRTSPINRIILAISFVVTLWNLENALLAMGGPMPAPVVNLVRLGGVFLAPTFLHLVLVLSPRKRPGAWFLRSIYVLGAIFYLMGADPHLLAKFLFTGGRISPDGTATVVLAVYGFYFAGCVGFGGWTLWRAWLGERESVARNRLAFTGLAAMAAIALSAVGCGDSPLPAAHLLTISSSFLYLLAISWNVLRYGLADLSLFMRQNMIYSLALSGMAGLYVLFVIGAGVALENWFHLGGNWSSLVAAIIVAPTFYPMKEWLEARLKRVFPLLRDRRGEELKNLTAEINGLFSLDELAALAATRLIDIMNLTGVCLFFQMPKGVVRWSGTVESGEVRISRGPADADCVPAQDEQLLVRLPIRRGQTEVGALVLHRRVGGEVFTLEEQKLLAAFAAQLGMSMENIRLHDELVDKERQVQRAERLSAMGRLTAGLAHEIRNGLHKIGGCAYIIKDEVPQREDLVAAADGIVEETNALAEFLDKFLSFAREQRGERVAYSPREVLADVIQSLQPEMKKHRISPHFSWPDEKLAVEGNPGAVRQAFLNLTINALEAMEHGGDLSIRLSREGTTCRAEIQDSGPGIPRDYLDQIFDPFFTTKPDGTGLGLPIADQTIRGQGGEIRVESSPEGSAFTVILPLMKEEEA